MAPLRARTAHRHSLDACGRSRGRSASAGAPVSPGSAATNVLLRLGRRMLPRAVSEPQHRRPRRANRGGRATGASSVSADAGGRATGARACNAASSSTGAGRRTARRRALAPPPAAGFFLSGMQPAPGLLHRRGEGGRAGGGRTDVAAGSLYSGWRRVRQRRLRGRRRGRQPGFHSDWRGGNGRRRSRRRGYFIGGSAAAAARLAQRRRPRPRSPDHPIVAAGPTGASPWRRRRAYRAER